MTVIYTTNFDDGTLNSAFAEGTSATIPAVSTTSPYSGSHCMKSEINPAATNLDARSEVLFKNIEPANATSDDEFILGKEYWLGFAFKADADYPDNETNNWDEIICQWHNWNGSAYLTPAWHLNANRSNGTTINLTLRKSVGTTGTTLLKAIALDTWHRIVVNFKLSTTTSGFFHVYVNDELLFSQTGIVSAASTHPRVFLKMGIYAPLYKYSEYKPAPGYGQRIVYHDSIKLADNVTGYSEVDPAAGAAPVDPPAPASITSVNGGTNSIVASTAANTAVTVEINGSVSATISDGTDSETVQAIPSTDGLLTYFNTGALTDIGTPATLSISHADPGYKDYNPRAWADNFTAVGHYTNYATAHGPFVLGQTYTVQSGDSIGNRYQVDSGFTATAGDTINARFFVVAGSGNKFRAQIYLDTDGTGGSTTRVVFSSALGALTCTENDLSVATPTVTETASLIYPGVTIIDVQFLLQAGTATNKVWFGWGTGTDTIGDSITSLGAILWKNRALVSHDISVSIPALIPEGSDTLTLTTVSALTSGQVASVVGTNLDTCIAARIKNAGGATSVPINDWTSVGTTAANFTVPFGLPSGALELECTYAPSAIFSNDASAWSNNTGGTLETTLYTTATWAAPTGLTIISDGTTWHRTSQQMSYVRIGETVSCQFMYIPGSSGRVVVNMRMGNVNLGWAGVVGELPAQPTESRHGSNYSIAQTVINGVNVVTVTFVSTLEGYVSLGMGADSSVGGQTVTVLAKRSWTDTDNATVDLAVTVATNEIKKFVWSSADGNRIYCYNADTNTFTPFTGNMAITITDGDWFEEGDNVIELAYAPVVAFVAGEGEMLESNLTFGSINALLTGAQGYNYWATSGACRADNSIELTAV